MAAKSSMLSLPNRRMPTDVEPSTPLYKEVKRKILQCLAEGEWKPGDRLPSEAQLAERFGVAVFTIRTGIQELVAKNILVRWQGKGTFVAEHGGKRQRYQFFHIFRNDGTRMLPSRRLIAFEPAIADDEVRSVFGLAKRGRSPDVLRLLLELSVDGELLAVPEIFLPKRRFTDLSADLVSNSGDNLYAVYARHCGVNVLRMEERITAVRAEEPAASMLAVVPGDPVLRITRTAFTFNNVPVEVRRTIVEPRQHHYLFSQEAI